MSFLFERMLTDKIASLISEKTPSNIYEVYHNVEIYQNKNKVAEYDFLIATKQGTCKVLDAKTYETDYKDLDARLLNLREGAGRYVDFMLVFPLYEGDPLETYFPQKILNSIDTANKRKMNFYTISDNDFVFPTKDGIIKVASLKKLFNIKK